MAQSTEAACLLQSGAMYPARVGLRIEGGEDALFGIKPGGLSLYIGDQPIYHFDFEGRWQRAFVEGQHYLKGLDASVRRVGREREESGLVLRRRLLEADEVDAIDESIRRAAAGLIAGIDAGRVPSISPPPNARMIGLGELKGSLERIARWDAAGWRAHRDRYRATYGPWPFLPPDCPNPIVLQVSTGSAFGIGPPAGRGARSSREFREHAEAVAGLVGRRAGQCRDVFLAGLDALRRPTPAILEDLDAIDRTFPIFLDPVRLGNSGGHEPVVSRVNVVHAWLEDFRPPLPDREGWRMLRAARLGRVTLGIESGDPAIRRSQGKSWTDEEFRETVADLKAAGIGVGLVVLVGSGGRAMAPGHLEASAGLVGSLPLAEGDLISLVDARSLGLAPVGSEPLSAEETAGQLAALKRRLVAGRPSKGPRVVPYNPDKQWA